MGVLEGGREAKARDWPLGEASLNFTCAKFSQLRLIFIAPVSTITDKREMEATVDFNCLLLKNYRF